MYSLHVGMQDNPWTWIIQMNKQTNIDMIIIILNQQPPIENNFNIAIIALNPCCKYLATLNLH